MLGECVYCDYFVIAGGGYECHAGALLVILATIKTQSVTRH